MIRTISIESLSSQEKTALLIKLIEDKSERTVNFVKNVSQNKDMFEAHAREITDYADSIRIIKREARELLNSYSEADDMIGNYIEQEQIIPRHTEDADLS